MAMKRVGLFVGGVAVGAVLAGVLVGLPRKTEPVAASAPPPGAAVQPAAVTASTRTVDCSFAPMVPAASKDDGLLPLDKDLQGNSSAAVATLVLAGKEASAAGKPRDAETAFLMACRTGESVKNDPIPLADAQYQLGRHYAQVAAPPDAPQRAELLRRAEALYASSLQVYQRLRGAGHEKTRFAQEGLDALHRLTSSAPAPGVTAAPEADEDNARAAANTRVAGGAQEPVAPAPSPVEAAPPVAAARAPKPERPKAAETVKAPEPRKTAEVKPEVKPEKKAEAKAEPVEEPEQVSVAPPPPREVRRKPRVVVAPEPVPEPVPIEVAPIEVAPEPTLPEPPPVEALAEPPATASGTTE